MRVAIVHDYLFQFGGAEKCVENWLEIYQTADIYTSFSFPQKFTDSKLISLAFKEDRVKNSAAQVIFNLGFLKRYQKHFYWLYSVVMRFWKIKDYDLVIISSTFCAKNVRFKNCSKIVFYCHTPTRFLYNLVSLDDQKTINPILKLMMKLINWPLRIIDQNAVKYLTKIGTEFIANSRFIQGKIKEIYKLDSKIVYPPVDLKEFNLIQPKPNQTAPFYFYFGRISFHKRLDLAIKSCLNLNRKLIIAGTSALEEDLDYLKKLVLDFEVLKPDKKGLVVFAGRVSDHQRNDYLKTCTAMLFPGREDFGIAPVEALAAGVPVIAYKAGGALEYIQEKVNGVFFKEQTTKSLEGAILEFEKLIFETKRIKESSKGFSQENFRGAFEF